MEIPLPVHPKVVEGCIVWDWPEFHALCKRLGIRVPKLPESTDPRYPGMRGAPPGWDGTWVMRVEEGRGVCGTRYDGFEVWKWPEYQAFCRRLGIPVGLWDIATKFILSEGEACKIIHTFMAMDTKTPFGRVERSPEVVETLTIGGETDQKFEGEEPILLCGKAIDNTTAFNEKWRTYSPSTLVSKEPSRE